MDVQITARLIDVTHNKLKVSITLEVHEWRRICSIIGESEGRAGGYYSPLHDIMLNVKTAINNIEKREEIQIEHE